MAADKKRLNYVDMVKGICILIMVLYHLLAPSDPIRTWIGHVEDSAVLIFFLFSGYFYKPGAKPVGKGLAARARSLLIPFFKHSLILWGIATVYYLITGKVPFIEALCCLRNFFGGCIWNRVIQGWFGWEYYHLGSRYLFLADFWFLLAMMFANIIFQPLANRLLQTENKRAMISRGATALLLLFVVTGSCRAFDISLPYNLQLVPFWAAFLLIGCMLGRLKLIEHPALTGARGWISALLPLIAGIVLSVYKPVNSNLFRGNFEEPEVLSMVLGIVAALCLAWGLAQLCRQIELAGVRVQELAWLGSHTMLIYLYHVFFGWVINVVTGNAFSVAEGDPVTLGMRLAYFVMVCVSLALCILLYVISDRLARSKSSSGK